MARKQKQPTISSDVALKPKVTTRKRLSLKQAVLYSFGLCGACFLITMLFPSTPKPQSLPTAAVLPSNTPMGFGVTRGPETRTPTPAIDQATSITALSNAMLDNGQVNWAIEQVTTQNTAAEWNPKQSMTYLVVAGTIYNHSDQDVSLRANQVRVLIDGQEYAPLNGLMDRIKPDLNGMDFIGAYGGLSLTAGQSQKVFVAFEIPLVRDSVSIRLDTQTLALNRASGIEIALGATLTPDASRTAISLTGGAVMTELIQSDNTTATAQTLSQTADAATYSAMALSMDQTRAAQPTATITDTPLPVPTSVPATAVANQRNETRMIQSPANLRPCPRRTDDCPTIVQLQPGASIVITGDVQGDTVSQSTLWYVAEYQGKVVYVHSSLVAAAGVTSLPATSVPVVQPPAQSNVIVIGSQNQSVVPAQTWDCSIDYDCGDFDKNPAGLNAYWAACPGDPSNLDGHPEDGVPCNGSK